MITDTIVALSTAPMPSALGVIRMSGSSSFEILSKIFNKEIPSFSKNLILHGNIIDNDQIVDDVLVYLYKNPFSFTGEDSVEISCHGGLIVIHQILSLCYKFGARQADRGEFSKRAYLNNKIDLLQAESINDFIMSNNELSSKIAMMGIRGKTSSRLDNLRKDILEVLSHIEVNIDYPEYEDIEEVTNSFLLPKLPPLIDLCKQIIDQGEVGKIIKDGFKVAIVGEPNVGKSSILNSLLEENKAIVTEIPGTTRDIVEGRIVIDGIPFLLLDTAGIRQTKDLVESIGVKKSIETIEQADIICLVLSSLDSKEYNLSKIKEYKNKYKNLIIVLNKNDLNNENIEDTISISALKNDVTKLKDALVKFTGLSINDFNTMAILTNSRQIGLMQGAYNHLMDAYKACKEYTPVDLVAIDIRSALENISEILGLRSGLEDEIFSRFCVGK